MSKRKNLGKGRSVLLRGEGEGRKVTIIKKVGEDVSSICYEAYLENSSSKGVLKEFYPEFAGRLKRNAAGRLIQADRSDGGRGTFEKVKQEYVEPYVEMRDIKENGRSRELKTFIPDFEIYDGRNDDNSEIETAYIWMPEARRETFAHICNEIHRQPSVKPERKLAIALSAIKYLTERIKALHQENMIHRNIEPSNFGFVKFGDEVLGQTLSMVDISSVCQMSHVPDDTMGTEGYREPETGFERATNQTDIYAIGAMLFHAIIVSEELKAGKYLYRDEYYSRLKELVDNSKLIQNSEVNDHPRLRNMLTAILQKCLCEREGRYADCGELLEDVDAALKWVSADVESTLDRNRVKNTALALQYHLYEHPLYQCAAGKDIYLLIIGFGYYGQRFLDSCLQIGRMRNTALHVTIVSDDVTDMGLYLQDRPGLTEFFTGSLTCTDEAEKQEQLKRFSHFFNDKQQEDSYGNIVFQVTSLKRDDQKANEKILENIVMYENDETNYVFIALGEDGQNLAAAKACENVVKAFGTKCMISYVHEGERSVVKDAENMAAVYVKEDVRKSKLYPEIERMAFNSHLIWEKNLNVDFGSVKADYGKLYNRYSCVSHVVAMKYWLHGLGIDLENGYDAAAKSFVEKAFDTKTESLKIKNELIWLEHRRWVTEKLCLGWRPIKDLEICMDGTTKDEREKRHICIQKSRVGQGLVDACKKDSGYWDNKAANLNVLDDLDRMSVLLHRKFVEKAKAARQKNLLSGNNIDIIGELIADRRESIAAFQEWFGCLKDIWNGDRDKVTLYKGLKNRFLQSVDDLADSRSIKAQVKAFEKMFYPILASMEYKDYKQTDVDFIENIPFILTYTENVYMVTPLAVGNSTDVFDNVAAATVVNPARVLYMCSLADGQDEQSLKETIPCIISYMDKRRIRSKVEFIIGYTDYLSRGEEKLVKSIRQMAPQRIERIKFIQAEEKGLGIAFEEYLLKRRAKGRVIAIKRKQKGCKYLLDDELFGTDLYKKFPNFKFKSVKQEFSMVTDCSPVEYIKKMPCMTAADMAALQRSFSMKSRNPEFANEYETLWTKYKENEGKTWKELCVTLGDYANKYDEIASFERVKMSGRGIAQEYRYIVPFACRKTISILLEKLKKENIIESESRIREYTTDSCEVVILDSCNNGEEYKNLFGNIYKLMMPDAVEIYLVDGTHQVKVRFDDLVVSEVFVRNSQIEELMRFLEEKGCVIDLKIENNKMSFVYATRAIKELLTTAGKILEVYVYHKVKDSGKFDDVVSSYEINWEETEIKNEFDCILTKGFQSIFVECKAKKNIEADDYTKLDSLTNHFGINVKKVLIADTWDEEHPYYDDAKANKRQMERGKMLGIETIWKRNEIENISETLLQILEGTSGRE